MSRPTQKKRLTDSSTVVGWILRTCRLPAALLIGVACLSIFCASSAAAEEQVVELIVSPSPIRLGGFRSRQQILVTGRTSTDRKIDLTRDAEFQLEKPGTGSLRLSGSVLEATADGRASLQVAYKSLKVRVPVIVESYDPSPPVHFENDIIPVLSKLGCNSGGCHGKASGQNGFKLSVFGFDVDADYNALTKEARGRRVFSGDPRSSLLVSKAAGLTVHGGGRRTDIGSPDYALLCRWIAQGVPRGRSDAATVQSILVEPSDRVAGRKSDQQLLVTAIFSDGKQRDVTAAAAYSSNAVVIADVEPGGIIRTGQVPGEAAITINYMGQVTAARILVPRSDGVVPPKQPPIYNPIDGFVWSKLDRMGIVPSDLCDDSTFLRRVFLDTIGTLPTPAEARKFLADERVDKRKRLVDEVLSREEYADYQTLRWADILLVDRETLGERGAYEFHQWLRDQMARNRPYDEWARELITATGVSSRNGPVNFYRAMRTPDDLAKAVSQAFMGIRMDCAQCHHHPFEKWSQDDFYGMAGFFNGLQRKSLSPTRELVYHAGHRATKFPRTDRVVPTRPPDGDVIDTTAADPRVQLADWLTSAENPWFSRLVSNRLWSQYLGRGLVVPVDDLRSTNPAVNEPLLAWLAGQVVENDFDLKAVARRIMNSRVYQLSNETNETNRRDTQNFSHYPAKRLPAQVLLDAVCQVTGVAEKFPGMPAGTRAVQVWDNRFPSYFLDTFGRSERQSPCECGKSEAPTMAQALHLMNAPELDAKISSEHGRLTKLLSSGASAEQILEELSLAAWSRHPTKQERTVAERLFQSAPREQAAGDLMWTVLNSYSFLFVR